MDRSLTLYEIPLPHENLDKAHVQETAFYLQIMTILHDIYALQRAIIISGPKLGESVVDGSVVSSQVAQSFSFVKSLAGVLCEAYECMQFGYYADNRLALKCRGFKKYKVRNKFIKKYNMVDLDSVYEPLMSKDAKNAQEALEKYFSKKNLLRRLRNKYAFHYDFQEAVKNIRKFKEIDDPHIILEESSANCCYVSANQWLILRALQVKADEKKLKEKFEKLMEEAVEQAKNMADFFHGFILAYSEKYLNVDMSKAKGSTLDNVMFIDEIKFPFFSKRRQT